MQTKKTESQPTREQTFVAPLPDKDPGTLPYGAHLTVDGRRSTITKGRPVRKVTRPAGK